VQRQDVEFAAEGGVTLRGWLFVPDGSGPHPAITMAHGFAGVKEHGLERFARVFAAAGFVVLVHDHRGFGTSGGSPRYDIDPWVQIADWRRAISYLESQPFVDPNRIGLWGSSYAGGFWKTEMPGIGGDAMCHYGHLGGLFAAFYVGTDQVCVTVFNHEGSSWEWLGDEIASAALNASQAAP